MVPVLHSLSHWTHNIFLDKLLYKKILSNYNRTTAMKSELFLNRINVQKKGLCYLPKSHRQCTWKTMLHDIIISLQFRRKHCFQS